MSVWLMPPASQNPSVGHLGSAEGRLDVASLCQVLSQRFCEGMPHVSVLDGFDVVVAATVAHRDNGCDRGCFTGDGSTLAAC